MAWDGTSPLANGGAMVVNGGWGASAPPNGTTGVTFSVARAGRYLMSCTITGWSAGATLQTFGAWIDGGVSGSAQGYNSLFFNVANTHLTLPPAVFVIDLTAGTHWLYIQWTGTSDGNDRCALTWVRI